MLAEAKTLPDLVKAITGKAPPKSAAIDARRRTGAHYTPRDLADQIVSKTLEPIFLTMGAEPSSDRILNLRLADPAVGAGAFMVSACRQLAGHLLEAWAREGRVGSPREARRLIAERCLFAVDINPAAVVATKLCLWLETMEPGRSLPLLAGIRCGDALVGLDGEQLRALHWDRSKKGGSDAFRELFAADLEISLVERGRLLELAISTEDAAERERLAQDADAVVAPFRLVADIVVGAFFAAEKPKSREAELARRLAIVEAQWPKQEVRLG